MNDYSNDEVFPKHIWSVLCTLFLGSGIVHVRGIAHATGTNGTERGSGSESVIGRGSERAPTVKTGKLEGCPVVTENAPLALRETGSGCDCSETGIENTGIDTARCSFIFFHLQLATTEGSPVICGCQFTFIYFL